MEHKWKIPISITLDEELIDKIDKKRKDVSRSRFIRDIIEKSM